MILPLARSPPRRRAGVNPLEHLSRGRFRLGSGCRLARRELEPFRGTMDEPREVILPAADPAAPDAKLRSRVTSCSGGARLDEDGLVTQGSRS
jgi:hypothetical protein